jgi:hypothetical protein
LKFLLQDKLEEDVVIEQEEDEELAPSDEDENDDMPEILTCVVHMRQATEQSKLTRIIYWPLSPRIR